MGAIGAVIMGFFGAVFASATLALQFGWKGAMLALPFLIFLLILLTARRLTGGKDSRIVRSARAKRAIMWSSIGEGIGIFLAANIVGNLGHLEWLLPAIALIVGLHFLPIAYAAPFRPFYGLGGALILAAVAGFLLPQPVGADIAGAGAAISLWIAALMALLRERQAGLAHERTARV